MWNEPISTVLTVNGEKYELKIGPTETLVDVLREKLGLTGTKIMCNEGECGSCTILMDGKPILSCLTLAVECEGKDILTIEGMADPQTGELHPIQKTFVERSGMQCGVCTPGMILSAKAFLDESGRRSARPDRTEIRHALAGNLCRCTGYQKIVDAVSMAWERLRLEEASRG